MIGKVAVEPEPQHDTLSLMKQSFTAIFHKEDDAYVALCPEVDVASQGATIEEARDNLREALELFFECASEEEIHSRVHRDAFISTLEIQVA